MRDTLGTEVSALSISIPQVLDDALVYLGSRVLYPSLAPVREADYYVLYSHPREVVESLRPLQLSRIPVEMIDFLLLHKDYELHREQYGTRRGLLSCGCNITGSALPMSLANSG